MAKLLQLTNASAQSVAANGFLNLGTITRRVGCDANCPTFTYNGSTLITLPRAGYYDIEITGDLTSTATTQQMSIGIIQDGTVISDLKAYSTVVGEVFTISRGLIIRVFCNSSASFALQNIGSASTTISNLNISIIKVA